MALHIDRTNALRTPEQLDALIAAIVIALPEDEPDWLEWKSTLDLRDKAVQGRIARTILGMANRPLATALQAMEGYSYIVIGAEPRSVAGITRIDPSGLGRGIQPYLGPNGPGWRAEYILHAGSASVLVITVDPPRSGDRIRTLDKETERPRNLRGTVLIRRPGETAQADPSEIRAMEDRFAAPLLQASKDRAHEQKRLQLEKISEALGAAFDKVKDANTADRLQVIWTRERDRLEEALDAWEGPEMPNVLIFVRAGTAYQALMYYGAARADVKSQFFLLDQERQAAGRN
jgi:hypothetical protein